MESDPRRLISRLAAAVMTADGRITTSETEALRRLDELGLGPLSAMTEEEIQRSILQPIDVRSACEGLLSIGPDGASILFTALAEIAASDRVISALEVDTLRRVATCLGLPATDAEYILQSAIAAYGAVPRPREDDRRAPEPATPILADRPPAAPAGVEATAESRLRWAAGLAQAYRILGLEPDAVPQQVEQAYLNLIERYNPAKVVDLGPDFAALAVRKLAQATQAFELVRGTADPGN